MKAVIFSKSSFDQDTLSSLLLSFISPFLFDFWVRDATNVLQSSVQVFF